MTLESGQRLGTNKSAVHHWVKGAELSGATPGYLSSLRRSPPRGNAPWWFSEARGGRLPGFRSEGKWVRRYAW